MNIIKVRVIPNAKKQKIVQNADIFRVYVNAPAEGGRANKALIAALAEYFDINKNSIKIIKGERSRDKVVQIR